MRQRLISGAAVVLVLLLAACRPGSVSGAFNGGVPLVIPAPERTVELVDSPARRTPSIAFAPDGAGWLTTLEEDLASNTTWNVQGPATLYRFLPGGALDEAFGDGGRLDVSSLAEPVDGAPIVLARPGGGAYLVGQTGGRLQIDLVSDMGDRTPFYTGRPVAPNPFFFTVIEATIDAAGRLVVVGYNSMDGVVERILPDGTVDPSFPQVPTGGVSTLLATLGDEVAVWDATAGMRWVRADGSIVTVPATDDVEAMEPDGTGGLVVTQYDVSSGLGVLSRFTAGGAQDLSYGGDGTAELPAIGTVRIEGLAALGAGRMVVSTSDGAVAVDGSGAIEPAWAGDGRIDFGGTATAEPAFADLEGHAATAPGVDTMVALVQSTQEPESPPQVVTYAASTGLVRADLPGGGITPVPRSWYPLPTEAPSAVVATDRIAVIAAEAPHVLGQRGMPVYGVTFEGALDAGFGDGGRVDLPIGSFASSIYASSERGLVESPSGYFAISGREGGLITLSALAADGVPDAAFGDGGTIVLPPAYGVVAAMTQGGEIVVSGTGATGEALQGPWLRRYGPDGSVLAERLVPLEPPWNISTHALVAVDGVGRTVRAVTTCSLPSGCSTEVRRFLPDLSDDVSFGTGGVVTLPAFGTTFPREGKLLDLHVTDDGVVTVAQGELFTSTLVRLDEHGAFDAAYGTGGVATTTALIAGDATVDAAGRVVLAGFNAQGAAVARLDGSGALDPEFGTDGLAVRPGDEVRYWSAVDVAEEGWIAVAGVRGEAESAQVAVARLLGGP